MGVVCARGVGRSGRILSLYFSDRSLYDGPRDAYDSVCIEKH